MSWNPFSRYSASKRSVIPRVQEREFDREVKKIEQLDEATRKLYKDMKRCAESNTALVKSEHKITQDLLASPLCQTENDFHGNMEEWDKLLDRLDRSNQEMNATCQKTVIEPMRKFSSIFPSVQAAIKKREQSLQEYTKCQARVEKYKDRERTGQNVVKLDGGKVTESSKVQKALETAKHDFTSQNAVLVEDMPKLYDGRIEYFEPSFKALINSQIAYNTETVKEYSDLSTQLSAYQELSEEYNNRIQQSLADIKALAITAD